MIYSRYHLPIKGITGWGREGRKKMPEAGIKSLLLHVPVLCLYKNKDRKRHTPTYWAV